MYFEEEEIRTMFANLIASSMDSRKVNEVYPSFSEIIKQMSKLDAENLKIIYTTSNKYSRICQIKMPAKSGGFRTIFTNVFIDNINNKDYQSNSSSISNLSRLGLIDISYSQFFVDEDIYREFEESDIFQKAVLIQEEYNTNHNFLPDDPSSYLRPEVVKGIVSITPFGESFSCVSKNLISLFSNNFMWICIAIIEVNNETMIVDKISILPPLCIKKHLFSLKSCIIE